ncbi:MAG TPA: hypothetical protein VM238_07125 [Phycisphaerae bacterium]|nr:hypothetical protein [Phycisphaerae bacterium]
MNTNPEGKSPKDKEWYAMKRFEAETCHEAELFKTIATFGAFAVAVFGLGGPIVLALAEGLDRCFRQLMIALAGVAALLIAAYILHFYRGLAERAHAERASNVGSDREPQAQPTGQAQAKSGEDSQ